MTQSNVNKTALLSGIMIILGIVLPYIGLGNYLLGRDEAYQALCVMNYRECPLAMLTFYIGNLWTRLFGNEILSLRCLMALCYQFSIAVSCCYLYWRKRNLLLASVMFLMMNLGFRYVNLTLYGWDSGAYPFMAIFAVSLLVYLNKPSLRNICLVGVATGTMVMSRIPTLASLPFILVVIIFMCGNDKRAIWIHGVGGLVSFGITTLLLIVIMTSGDINVYIQAWNPDNIINGHFEKEFIVWRWKDTARSVITAFYPMICCFACACYMMRVQRFYRLNYVLCGIVCAVLSFYLLKTYRLHSGYACGIYESLFLIIILFPWLYKMTHREVDYVPLFPLLAIVGCSLLAGVGSDGFLERPMTINTVPLLCIYVYNEQSARVLKCFFVFVLLSAAMMLGLVLVGDARNITFEYENKPHLAGIKSDRRDIVIKRFSAVAPIIESLKKDESGCAIVGTDRYEFDYVYNGRVEYNLHHFYYYDREEDIGVIDRLAGKYDYILIICNLKGEGYSVTEKYLRENRYEITHDGYWCKLFRLSH